MINTYSMDYFFATVLFFCSLIGLRIKQKKIAALGWDFVDTQFSGLSLISVLFDFFSLSRVSDKYESSTGYVEIVSASMFVGMLTLYVFGMQGTSIFLRFGVLFSFIFLSFCFSLWWIRVDKTVKSAYGLEVSALAAVSLGMTIFFSYAHWTIFPILISFIIGFGYSRVFFR